ncbi:MAG: hypothetical protein HGA38_00260 [Candidatus Moranbacteria bacterium]|nr:hypothetical protein [Candidatus Moranbacteria bacterium]NTW45969.1 hypothetical protein [Candidatus Moranbacteria bacterium]
MEQCKDKILLVVRGVSSDDDCRMWEDILGYVPDEACADILRFLEEDPKNIASLSARLRRKIMAVVNLDEEAWDAALKEDVEYLRSMIPSDLLDEADRRLSETGEVVSQAPEA